MIKRRWLPVPLSGVEIDVYTHITIVENLIETYYWALGC
jgi:hypothetical protein